MPTLEKIRMRFGIASGFTSTTFVVIGFVWTAEGAVVAQSAPLEFTDGPGGTTVLAEFEFNDVIPDGVTYYYGATVASVVSGDGYPLVQHPDGQNARLISNDGEHDQSMGYSPGAWLKMFDVSGLPNRITAVNFGLVFDTGAFDTEAGGGFVGKGAIKEEAKFIGFGAIYSTPQLLKANFLGTPRKGPATLQVTFTDQSIGDILPTTWLWNFGDGGPTSSAQNPPLHDYTALGLYTVSLTVNNGVDPESSITREAYIVVTGDCGMTVEMAAKEVSSNFTIDEGTFFSGKKETPITLINSGFVCFEPHAANNNPFLFEWSFRKNGSGDDYEVFSLEEKPIKKFS
jgi:hypothetical protein